MIIVIAAIGKNNVIGSKGQMPWNIPEEMEIFKKKTLNSTVIMGRKTYESIGRPLPNRNNIVISRNKELEKNGITVCESLKLGLEVGKKNTGDIYIIGGGQLYLEGIEYADKLYISFLKDSYDGDCYFPEVNWKNFHKIYEKEYKNFIYIEFVKI